MSHARIAIRTVAALFAAAFWLAGLSGTAAAQQLNLNVGCPTLGSPDFGTLTFDELNERCFGDAGGGGNAPPKPAEDGAILTCGQHRALALAGRINVGYVEGQVSQQVVDDLCDEPGLGDDAIPAGSQIGGNQLQGYYRFERGYKTRYTGAKLQICQPYYTGNAYLDRGTITFTSGGHTWTGTISQNSFISITREGVTPRPKNFTVISGPLLDAKLYNGYCGEGFFRLLLS